MQFRLRLSNRSYVHIMSGYPLCLPIRPGYVQVSTSIRQPRWIRHSCWFAYTDKRAFDASQRKLFSYFLYNCFCSWYGQRESEVWSASVIGLMTWPGHMVWCGRSVKYKWFCHVVKQTGFGCLINEVK